ncbi:hypothetical protein [Modestobacter sp. Leaf380]|uniref:hypothetical protein n=1 Tax=Modestobacter sp. Leaf380 TaxID=1736356 RepID=UPI0012F8950E|nr:hypothetical protein [Modestobacter sp. Leaf380]
MSKAFASLDLDAYDIWLEYAALGGDWPLAFVEFALTLDGPAASAEYLVLVQAINEVLIDRDGDQRASRHLRQQTANPGL